MRRRFIPLLTQGFLMQGLMGYGYVQAQGPDPTRPSGQDAGSAVQTVIMRPGGMPTAVVYGEQVTIGDKIGDRRVKAISEREVTLESSRGIEILKVMPSVEKVPRAKGAVETRHVESGAHRSARKGTAAE